jgi:hypothetical protein
VQLDASVVYVCSKVDDEIYSLGMQREILRRIQSMRKELELTNTDKILVHVNADQTLLKTLSDCSNIQKVANCILSQTAIEKPDIQKDWEIDSKAISISIKKTSV